MLISLDDLGLTHTRKWKDADNANAGCPTSLLERTVRNGAAFSLHRADCLRSSENRHIAVAACHLSEQHLVGPQGLALVGPDIVEAANDLGAVESVGCRTSAMARSRRFWHFSV